MFSTRHITLWLLIRVSDVAVCISLDHDNQYLILWFVYSWICLLNNRFKFRKCSVSDSAAPVMFLPLNVRLEYWFQHVTFMLNMYYSLGTSTEKFQASQLIVFLGLWCSGLTICLLLTRFSEFYFQTTVCNSIQRKTVYSLLWTIRTYIFTYTLISWNILILYFLFVYLSSQQIHYFGQLPCTLFPIDVALTFVLGESALVAASLSRRSKC